MHPTSIMLIAFISLIMLFPRGNDRYKQRDYINYNVPPESSIWKFLDKNNQITFNLSFDPYSPSVIVDCFPPFNVTLNSRKFKEGDQMTLWLKHETKNAVYLSNSVYFIQKTKMSKELFVDLESNLLDAYDKSDAKSFNVVGLISALKDVLKLSIEYEKSKEYQPKEEPIQ